ncbi:response regulator transcription factor [Sphaerisporangium corydalis]|uniref:Response regulator transcription factor n=1 Tax=Sphaerisporangium corydalis TaxID=1441875 RepID=A0ABV9EM25_9ACTN|nr:response regulator transcription factor [Sphaerisporangium corydalis]
MTRVLVVEDQRALAGALEIAIGAQPDLDCVGTAGTVEEAVRLVETRSPDVVLMDVHLPGDDGIEGTRRIKAAHPGIRVLILTGDPTPGLLGAAATAGATGFLPKDSAFPDILRVIRASVDDAIVMVEGGTFRELFKGAGPGAAPPGDDRTGLTARELEVLGLMGEGLDPQAIAGHLVLSPHTARGHVKNVMMKLGAHSQLEAVVVAHRMGLLPGPRATGAGHRSGPSGGGGRTT